MTDRLVIHGVNLTEMGICDVSRETNYHDAEVALTEHFVRQILGSITFGPVRIEETGVFEELDISDDDPDWEYAE